MASGKTPLRLGVIMAGGSGERFWPLSRRDRPKQLLKLTSADESMLAEAVARIAPLIPAEHVYVVTGSHLADAIRGANVGTPPENVLAEPAKRNTAGALAYAAAFLNAKYGAEHLDFTMAVMTADHVIHDTQKFVQAIDAALTVAERDDCLAILGIPPTRPETSFGYIQIQARTEPLPETPHGVAVYPVGAFHEKPSRERAEDFIESGRYCWNSGMFFWKLSTFMEELDAARPVLSHALREITRALRIGDDDKVQGLFEDLEDISIDYALMEHARRVVMARAEFHWDDVGSWPALERTRVQDENGNVLHGAPVVLDSRRCIVYNDAGLENMAVAVIGVEDLVVAVTPDGVLVVPKDRAQDVRHAVAELKRRNAGHI